MESSLGHVPEKAKWEFDASVAKVFDDMLERSIPEYRAMRSLVTRLAKRYATPGTAVLDLGASRGEALAELVDDPALSGCFFTAYEIAPAMLDELRARWPQLPYDMETHTTPKKVHVEDVDLRKPFSVWGCSVVLSVLTLQFVPIEHRLRIVRDAWRSLMPGGAFVLVEKVLGESADLDAAFVDEYYAEKRANGYSQEEIDRKRLSLEGVLVPVTARWNVDMLKGAGFSEVDCFWRHLNFCGWIAVK